MSFSTKKTLYNHKGGGAKLGVQRILLSLDCFASLSQIDGESSMDGDWGQYGRLNIEAQSNFPLNGPLHIVHKDICILLLCKSHLSQICNTWVLREGCKKNTWQLKVICNRWTVAGHITLWYWLLDLRSLFILTFDMGRPFVLQLLHGWQWLQWWHWLQWLQWL